MRYLLLLLLMIQFSFALNGNDAYFKMKKSAYTLYDHGQEQKAITYVKSFLKVYPKNIRGKNLLAVFYYWQGEKNKAKKILKEIVRVQRFKPAIRLLQKIDKDYKLTQTKTVQSDVKHDLEYMLKYVQKDPTNIIDRKFLVNYFISINDKKHALKIAKEVLRINPDDLEMLSFLKQNGAAIPKDTKIAQQTTQTKDKAISILNDYYQNKAYDRFINLYKALNDKREYIPTYVHLQALNAAVEMQKYPLAKKILLENNFQPSVHLQQFKELIDQKLRLANLYLVE